MSENLQFPSEAKEKSDWKRLAPFLVAFVVAAGGIGYAVHEHNSAQTLTWQNQQMEAQLDATHKQLDSTNSQLMALSGKVDALSAKPSPAVVAHRGLVTVAPRKVVVHDSRYQKMQAQLDAQNKAISDTQNDLASTKTELSGSIAKTHDELVVLQRRGQRSYYEFDLDKSKQFARTGPMSISLRKANWKKGYADLNLIVDDRKLQQKHVNLFQPTMFYDPDSPQPMELVINDISKNHIHGYISAPKYHRSELEAMEKGAQAPDSQTASANTDAAPPLRKRLTVPKDDAAQ